MEHHYDVAVRWSGNRGSGTVGYRSYDRTHEVRVEGKPVIPGSSEPSFRGEPDRWSPEELLVAALSQCHMLWYLHLAAMAGVVVVGYSDAATGTMVTDRDGGGRFTGVVLRPSVTVADPAMSQRAQELHTEANAKCFIAQSVSFEVEHQPSVAVAAAQT